MKEYKLKLNINSVSSHLPLALSICLSIFNILLYNIPCSRFVQYILMLHYVTDIKLKKKNKNEKKIIIDVSEITNVLHKAKNAPICRIEL